MSKNYRYFTIDEDALRFKDDKSWYWVFHQQLAHYYPDGEHALLPHLAKKPWFTEQMFWEILEFAKEQYPETNFDKAIWQVSRIFHEIYVLDNFDHFQRLNEIQETANEQSIELEKLTSRDDNG